MIAKKRLAAVLLFGSASLVACSHGGGSSSSGGDTSFSVTDASSDQIQTFTVDVTDISLTQPSGAVVHTLPAKQRVDFSDLVNESQLLTAFGGLAGIYKSVSMTLDFSNANVVLSGQSTPATIKDQNGNVVSGPITLPIQLPNGAPLAVAPGFHRLVSLDFDLDGSCAIDTATNTVQLGPVIKAEAQPTSPKPHNVAGMFTSLNRTAGTISITINGPLAPTPGPTFTINTTSSTFFYVEGVPSLGTAGLTAIAALSSGRPIIAAQGSIDPTTRSMTAKAVEAWIPRDLVHGHVTGRDAAGNLTVKGLAVDFVDGTSLPAAVVLNQTITVQAAAAKVYERFVGTQLDHNAVAVGARVFCRGNYNRTTNTLDCSKGQVFLPETGIFGFLNAPSAGGTLTVSVARFGRRPVSDFNFTVGTTVTANPNAYIVNTGSLNVASIASGAPLAIRGILVPWNQSPPGSAGFPFNAAAVTVIDRSAFALLYMDWTVAAPQNVRASSSAITLSSTGSVHHLVDPGFVAPIQLSGTVTIVPSTTTLSYFAISQNGAITLYVDFATFEGDLAARLAAGANGKAVAAIGGYNSTTQTLTANRLAVFLK